MPEGHSIHRQARYLQPRIVGQAIAAASPQGRFAESAKLINGRICTAVWAHGKHLFIEFDDLSIHIHLGLYGSWIFGNDGVFGAPRRIGEGDDRPAPGQLIPAPSQVLDFGLGSSAGVDPLLIAGVSPNTRLLLQWAGGWAALSGPTACKVVTPAEVATIVNRLGPDPIRGAGERDFIEVVRRRQTAIGLLVMDQSVIAGPGNIYRAECLFRTGINPWRAGARVSEARLHELWEDLSYLMRLGVDHGRIVTRQHQAKWLTKDSPKMSRYWVYQRLGEHCLRCGTAVAMRVAAGRKAYWCPGCQF